MPRGDRTGPNGAGPMTGRRAGFCAGASQPGYVAGTQGHGGRGMGRGFFGFRGGRGWRHWFGAAGRPGWLGFGAGPEEADARTLGRRIEDLSRETEVLRRRLRDIENSSDQD